MAAAAALLAIGLRAAASSSLTARMHNLLACSKSHPIPTGEKPRVAVVLGYVLHTNGSCTRPLQSRVEVALDLYKQGHVQHLLFSGAHPGGGVRNSSEANAMSEYALQLLGGEVPPGRWWLEEQSTSTRTNAVFSLAMIKQKQELHLQQLRAAEEGAQTMPADPNLGSALLGEEGSTGNPWGSIVLVTNPFHQLRSYWTLLHAMKEMGMEPDQGGRPGSLQLYVADAPFAGHHGYGVLDPLVDQVDFWRELGALALYKVRGYL